MNTLLFLRTWTSRFLSAMVVVAGLWAAGLVARGQEPSPHATTENKASIAISSLTFTGVTTPKFRFSVPASKIAPPCDASTLFCISGSPDNAWNHALDKGVVWTFTVGGKEYDIDGAMLARIVKMLGEKK